MVSDMLKAKLIINKKKIIENYNYYKEINHTTICVVKGNAYGTNIINIVKLLAKYEVKHFAVFSLKEAKQIRKINKDYFILLLNSIEAKDLKYCFKNNITLSINSIKDYNLLIANNYQGFVHIKLDTGMHRYGVNKTEFLNIIKDNILNINGIFSHLIGNSSYYKEIKKQVDLFDDILSNIDTSNYLIHITSTNSCKIIKSKYQNAIRIGMGLYGFSDHLNPALSLYLPITLKREIKKGEYCSYNNSFIAKENGFLYVIPLGYYNSLLPSTKISLKGFINAGNICMNCLTLFSKKEYTKKAITLNGYDLLKLCSDNNYSIYWLLSSFTS